MAATVCLPGPNMTAIFCPPLPKIIVHPAAILLGQDICTVEPQSYETQSYELFSQPKGDFTKHTHNHAPINIPCSCFAPLKLHLVSEI